MAEQNCQQCGAALDPNAVFCKNCGTRVSEPAIIEKTSNRNYSTYESPAANESTSANEGYVNGQTYSHPDTVTPVSGEYVAHVYTSQSQDPAYEHRETPASGAAINTMPLSTGHYLLMMILAGIPVIGLIVMLVFAFSAENINRRNFARASLIILLLAIVLLIIFSGIIAALFATFSANMDF